MKIGDIDLARWEGAPTAAAPDAIQKARSSLPPAERYAFLTADGQAATPLEQEALHGKNDLVEVSFLERCRLVMGCVGLLTFYLPRGRSNATGFLIAPGLLITNHHVFPDRDQARRASVQFDLWVDVAGQWPKQVEEYALDPDAFYISDPDLDFAVVAVAPRSQLGAAIEARGYLRLIQQTGKVRLTDFVTILQHPDGQPMQIALRENQVVRVEDSERFLWYRADTSHGSSGAPVFNDSLQLVALHSGGRIKRDGQGRYALSSGGWADSTEGLSETDVIWEANVGYRVSRIVASLVDKIRTEYPSHVSLIDEALQGGDVLAAAVERCRSSQSRAVAPTPERSAAESVRQENEVMSQPREPNKQGALTVPLYLRISVDTGPGDGTIGVTSDVARTTSASDVEPEAAKLQIPVIYDDLESRSGFRPEFIDDSHSAVPVPTLTAAGRKVAAPLLDGSVYELRYHHFSVWMHKTRRLALFTACNVDWRGRKAVVDGKKTNRNTLAGFPPDAKWLAEQWVTDPRIDEAHQLPDVFYTKDRTAFDKGHLVRRDDVCWGATFEDIQMANGDTYHVTNCSPQIKELNQGKFADDNWGALESYLQKELKPEAYGACIYAGPIFRKDDRWFHGLDDLGATRVQIPTSFWKIIVVKGDEGPEAYGFVLEQDVTEITETEFKVSPEWKAVQRPIPEIEEQLRGWVSLGELSAHDRYAA